MYHIWNKILETKTKISRRILEKKKGKFKPWIQKKKKILYLDIQSCHCFSYLNESTAEVRKNILFSVIGGKIYSRLFTICKKKILINSLFFIISAGWLCYVCDRGLVCWCWIVTLFIPPFHWFFLPIPQASAPRTIYSPGFGNKKIEKIPIFKNSVDPPLIFIYNILYW